MEALWSAALPLLRQHVGDRNFAAWIEPIRCHGADGEVRLEVPSRFFQSWVTRHFLSTIRDTVSELSGAPCTVRVVVADGRRRRSGVAPPTAPAPQPTARPPRAVRTPKIGRLVAHYTFETFVVGAANEVAFQRRAGGERGARQALQSGVPARRRRSRQDAPDQRHRARAAAPARAYADRVPVGRIVHERAHHLAATGSDECVSRALPAGRRVDPRRRRSSSPARSARRKSSSTPSTRCTSTRSRSC